jgi:uncharacterized protein (TIGR02001 family)
MNKRILATAVLAALPLLATGSAFAEEAADNPVVANVSLVSDYAYRGISQTDEKMALQGGFDYAHSSGLYVGVWGSNVSWIRDSEDAARDAGASFKSSHNSLEVDVYGGYKGTIGDFGYDVGLLQYVYPGRYTKTWRTSVAKRPDTLEGYVGLSYKFLTFKYSHAFTNLFGAPDSDGSKYLDLSAAYEIADGWTLNAHFGRQVIAGPAESYNDWKLGVTKAIAGVTLGLHYVDTDINHVDIAEPRVIFSVAKSF